MPYLDRLGETEHPAGMTSELPEARSVQTALVVMPVSVDEASTAVEPGVSRGFGSDRSRTCTKQG
jgi:hypothetical protein